MSAKKSKENKANKIGVGVTKPPLKNSLAPAQHANNEALNGLRRLDVLATRGDVQAIRMLHSITCGMVERLNEQYVAYSDSVLEWPVLLPQDRDLRKNVTMQANAMRIGSCRGGGEGAGRGSKDNLNYDSQKGFAIQNLRRVHFARSVLRPISPAYTHEENEESALVADTQITGTIDDSADFIALTGIMNFGEQLLLEIAMLPSYSLDTREKWIFVMAAVLRRNGHLVPEKFRDNQRKDESYTITNRVDDEREFTNTDWRGGILVMTLRSGLETVSSVPGFWGQ